MFIVAIFCTLIVASSADYCYNNVVEACGSGAISDGPLIANCNAKYGSIDAMQSELHGYANALIETSFEFLLMSSHFGNYEVNREGFKGLYRKLSDKAWDDAIDVIKYITKRGGKMNFNQSAHFKKSSKESVLEFNELNSLARALDTEKILADESLRLHIQAQHHTKQDPSIAHFIEEKFFESQAETVRNLAGHTHDLKNLLSDRHAAVAVFLFDEYLKKIL